MIRSIRISAVALSASTLATKNITYQKEAITGIVKSIEGKPVYTSDKILFGYVAYSEFDGELLMVFCDVDEELWLAEKEANKNKEIYLLPLIRPEFELMDGHFYVVRTEVAALFLQLSKADDKLTKISEVSTTLSPKDTKS